MRAAHEAFGDVAVKPILARLEASDNRMARRAVVRGRMFSQRLIAAADVSALGASAQVKPPAVFGETLDTAGARRRDVGLDALFGHDMYAFLFPYTGNYGDGSCVNEARNVAVPSTALQSTSFGE
jgi:hypothetical protein